MWTKHFFAGTVALICALSGRIVWGLWVAPWVLALMVAGDQRTSDLMTWRRAWVLRRDLGDEAILDAASLAQVIGVDVAGWVLTLWAAFQVWRWVMRALAK